MADTFQMGETIKCWRNVKDEDDNYIDPDTSFVISIYGPQNSLLVDEVGMTPDSVGKYHYMFDTCDCEIAGDYKVKYEATDNGYSVIFIDWFVLE